MADYLLRPSYDTSSSSAAGNSPVAKENMEWTDKDFVSEKEFASPGFLEKIKNFIAPLFLGKENNLSELTDKVAAFQNIGLGSFALSLSRNEIPSTRIPFSSFKVIGYYEHYDLGFGATYKQGKANNATDIQDVSGKWFTLHITEHCNVGWTGAKGDITTDDSESFILAGILSSTVVIPCNRTYNVKNVSFPSNRKIYSDSRGTASLRTLTGNPSTDYVIKLSNNTLVEGLIINGNNQVEKAIWAAGERISVKNCTWRYAYFGFYNEGFDIHYLTECVDDNCQYGIYSNERWITCVVDKHGSFGSVYAIYIRYDVQQPQTLIISNCTFESNSYGFFSENDVYFVVIENTSFNNMLVDGITLGPPKTPGTGSDIFIRNSYLSSAQRNLVVQPGWNHVVLETCGVADSKDVGVCFLANSTTRTTNVTLRDVNFGQSGGAPIYADSVKSLLVEKCNFAPTGEAPYNATADIVAPVNYTGGMTPKGKARYCTFQKPVPISPGSDFDIQDSF